MNVFNGFLGSFGNTAFLRGGEQERRGCVGKMMRTFHGPSLNLAH